MNADGVTTRACFQPWESLNIAADGKVYPCCVVHKTLEIGDLKANALEEIIASQPMFDIKMKILTGDISKLLCKGCPNGPMTSVQAFQRELFERYQQHAPTSDVAELIGDASIAPQTHADAVAVEEHLDPVASMAPSQLEGCAEGAWAGASPCTETRSVGVLLAAFSRVMRRIPLGWNHSARAEPRSDQTHFGR